MSSPTTRILIVHALSPLHAGTGQSTAAVDLPIARDRATNLPLLPGSSLKGALRARARAAGKGELSRDHLRMFGPETENASDYAGAIAFSDARLAFMPVRSVAGTFAWVTSPLLLAQLTRAAGEAGTKLPKELPTLKQEEAMIAGNSELKLNNKVILEEFDLTSKTTDEKWVEALSGALFPSDKTWQELFRKHLCIVHNDVMSFLAAHATEIVTRVSIDPETGTAKEHQLWTEENLPAESLLVALVEEVPVEKNAPSKPGDWLDELGELFKTPIQLGGKATVGRGRCALRFA